MNITQRQVQVAVCHFLSSQLVTNSQIGLADAEAIYRVVLDNNLENLLSQNPRIIETPFCIGMTYAQKLAIRKDVLPSGLGDLTFRDFNDIWEEWRHWNNPNFHAQIRGILNFVLFLADSGSQATKYYKTLTQLKAKHLATESTVDMRFEHRRNNGSTYFLDQRIAVFAINKGFNTIYKECAASYEMFTVCLVGENVNQDVTITTRSFEDAKFITSALGHTIDNSVPENSQMCRNTTVVIGMGLEGYNKDMQLKTVGTKLARHEFNVCYKIFGEAVGIADINESICDETLWNRKIKSIPRKEGDAMYRKFPDGAHFFITSIGCSAFKLGENYEQGPCSMTCTVFNESLEIKRIRGAQMKLLEFAENVLNS